LIGVLLLLRRRLFGLQSMFASLARQAHIAGLYLTDSGAGSTPRHWLSGFCGRGCAAGGGLVQDPTSVVGDS